MGHVARLGRLVVVTALLGAVCACGTGGPATEGVAGAAGDAQPSGSPTGSPGAGQGATTSEALQPLLVDATRLPDGFRESTGQAAPGYRMTLCGVDLEPRPPAETATRRFARSGVGPFVEQRVRRYGDDSQAEVLVAMRQALRSCGETSATDPASGASTTMRVRPLQLRQFADDSVAWHQEAVDRPVPTDVVLMRRGRTVVLVTSYTLGRVGDVGVVEQAATAAEALLRDAE
ncbi:hypothetical protein [Angustibacter aerolatus]|uniref:PknH-like extracellular domain-containing protein n=1 Tax=Angustibacter aerolatus TaxID=1162965 RepID=A0ABQ6JFE4_9ACTN|nr:hypothetical protein [Angustibacter aerolatus]GMA85491.1 hypothetical protein GCM10025868_07410 [Angustibacter aerolatus]